MTDLTIIMPCYNKESYIAEALDSVFAQRTRFSFCVVVVDDCSTDRTLEVAERYAASHPGVVSILKSPSNQGLYRNVLRAYAATKTPYFCVLDPDDYWISDSHVENALSFLATHPEFTIYSAEIQKLSPDGKTALCGFPHEERDSDFGDYLRSEATIAFTQTCVYRNVVFGKGLPRELAEYDSPTKERSLRGDSFRNFLHIREGKAHYSPSVEGCYRLTDAGVFQGLGRFGQIVLNAQLLADLWRYDGCRHYELLLQSRRMFWAACDSAFRDLSEKDVAEARRIAMLGALATLQDLYAREADALDDCQARCLAPMHRLRFAGYRSLRRKGIVK